MKLQYILGLWLVTVLSACTGGPSTPKSSSSSSVALSSSSLAVSSSSAKSSSSQVAVVSSVAQSLSSVASSSSVAPVPISSVSQSSSSAPIMLVDQCNSTTQCVDTYGPTATDCKDSKSDMSVCMCGNNRCDASPMMSSSSSIASSSSSVPRSSSSQAISSSLAASSSAPATPMYEFDLAKGAEVWQQESCGAGGCHGPAADKNGLRSSRTYNFIVTYLNTGSRVMPPGGPRCNNQCAKNVAGHIIYTIYKKPLPQANADIGQDLIVAINAGAGETFTQKGDYYQADAAFGGGAELATTDVITGSAEPLHQSARTGSFSYAIPLANGTYTVELGAAELYHDAIGERVFSLNVEGRTMTDIDLVKVAGHNVYLPLIFGDVEVTDGELTIAVDAGEGLITSITVTAAQ